MKFYCVGMRKFVDIPKANIKKSMKIVKGNKRYFLTGTYKGVKCPKVVSEKTYKSF